MLKEIAQYIADLATSQMTAKLIPIPGDPNNLLIQHGDALREYHHPRPNHEETTVATLADLLDAVAHYGNQGATSIWHNDRAVTAVLNDEDRREQIVMPLFYTDQWQAIEKMPIALPPAAMILYLKRTLCDALPPEVANAFRAVDFERRDGIQTRTAKDSESMGKSIHQSVTPSIPEYLTAHPLIFANPGIPYRQPIQISVDPLPAEGKIQLTPLADQVTRALIDAQLTLHQIIIDAIDDYTGTKAELLQPPTVFYGNPCFSE